MALKRAAELDAHLVKTGKVVGPLHGLPISLKDQFRIKVSLSSTATTSHLTSSSGLRNLDGLRFLDW